MANFNFQIDASLAWRLARLAERRDLSSDEIAERAIIEFIDRDESDILEIEAGLADAKQGDFASEAEVNAKGRVKGTRELVLVDIPCILVYRQTEATIEILTILHTSRRWPKEF